MNGQRAEPTGLTRKHARVVAAVAAVLVALAVIWSRVVSAAVVETVTITPAEFRAQAFGTGAVEARVSVEVGSKITGPVVKLLRDQGDFVERGELLAVIENDDLRQQRDQATFAQQRALESVRLGQANLARARAGLAARQARAAKASAELARITFDRFKDLYDGQIVARQELDVRSAELRSSDADVLSVRAEIDALEAEVQGSQADQDPWPR